MERLVFKPTFIPTKNVRNFAVMMDGLLLGAGDGWLGKVSGRAGLGKTRTVQTYAAHHNCVYLRVVSPMVKSETAFYEALCRVLGLTGVKRRSSDMFYAIADYLNQNRRPVFLDEAERLNHIIIDAIRDLCEVSTAPFVLIGEDELTGVMSRNARVWSRTIQSLEFEPVGAADIIFYFRECPGLELNAKSSALIHTCSTGDLRLVKRAALSIIQQINATGKKDVTEQMIKSAFAVSLQGGHSNARR